MADTDREGAEFEVICKRCKKRFHVIRNWGGGVRRLETDVYANSPDLYNPARCECGSRQLEIY